jgi:hypothetical protein
MRKIFVGLVLFIFTTCRQTNADKDRRILLQGDWIGWTGEGSLPGPWFIASFEDSLMTLGGYGDFVKYTLRGDSLFPDAKVDLNMFKLTKDSLIVGIYYEDERRNDTFRLSHVRSKNHIVPMKIFYSSSGCFGSCPSMHLEIDSSGKFLFWGRGNTKYKGAHRGQLTARQYQLLIARVQQVPLDSLKEHYEANWTDDQTESIVILTADKRIGTSVYGFDKEPVELRILFHKLSELYKTIPLQIDTTLTEKYFYRYNAPVIHLPPPIKPPGKRG